MFSWTQRRWLADLLLNRLESIRLFSDGLYVGLSVQCLIARGKLTDDQVELVFEDVVLLRLCVLFKLGKFLTDLGHGRFKSLGVGLGHLGQQLGDVVGQAGIWGEGIAAVVMNLVAVCAERGNVAGQRIAGFEQGKTVLQAVLVFFRVAAHVG